LKFIWFRHNKGIDAEQVAVDAEEEERFAYVERKQAMLALSYAIDFILLPVNFVVPRYFSSKTAAHLYSTRC